MKKSFVFYYDYYESMKLLSSGQIGDLLLAIMCRERGETLPELDDATKMAYSFIVRQIERDEKKYEEVRKARAEAGKKGGLQSAASKKTKQNQANQADTVTGTDTVTDTSVTVTVTGPVTVTEENTPCVREETACGEGLSCPKGVSPAGKGKKARGMKPGGAEWRRFYELRRLQAEKEGKKLEAQARSDEEYAAAEREIRRLEIETAKAEVREPEKAGELNRRLESARAKKTAALKRLNLTETDFLPHYRCPRCRDTGFLPSGEICGCYEEG